MELSELAINIFILFIPGIITFLIIDKLTVHKEYSFHNVIIYSLIFGFFSYIAYDLIVIPLVRRCFDVKISLSFFKVLNNKNAALNFNEIFYVSLVSIPIGFISSAFINYKLLHKIGLLLNVTKKFGDIDVWSYIMNSSDSTEWVFIRDKENDLLYEGWIEGFSDIGQNEIFLRDVIVYRNSDTEKLYEMPGIYISKDRKDLMIEFPNLEYTDFIKKREGTENE